MKRGATPGGTALRQGRQQTVGGRQAEGGERGRLRKTKRSSV
jgi:hypothetical protein